MTINVTLHQFTMNSSNIKNMCATLFKMQTQKERIDPNYNLPNAMFIISQRKLQYPWKTFPKQKTLHRNSYQTFSRPENYLPWKLCLPGGVSKMFIVISRRTVREKIPTQNCSNKYFWASMSYSEMKMKTHSKMLLKSERFVYLNIFFSLQSFFVLKFF